jgi:hypothetical protein
MATLGYVGIVFLVVGLVMTVFARPLGVAFCRIGKLAWKGNRIGVPSDEVDRLYDDSKAPKVFRLLGIVNLVQGAVFLAIALFTDWV